MRKDWLLLFWHKTIVLFWLAQRGLKMAVSARLGPARARRNPGRATTTGSRRAVEKICFTSSCFYTARYWHRSANVHSCEVHSHSLKAVKSSTVGESKWDSAEAACKCAGYEGIPHIKASLAGARTNLGTHSRMRQQRSTVPKMLLLWAASTMCWVRLLAFGTPMGIWSESSRPKEVTFHELGYEAVVWCVQNEKHQFWTSCCRMTPLEVVKELIRRLLHEHVVLHMHVWPRWRRSNIKVIQK